MLVYFYSLVFTEYISLALLNLNYLFVLSIRSSDAISKFSRVRMFLYVVIFVKMSFGMYQLSVFILASKWFLKKTSLMNELNNVNLIRNCSCPEARILAWTKPFEKQKMLPKYDAKKFMFAYFNFDVKFKFITISVTFILLAIQIQI